MKIETDNLLTVKNFAKYLGILKNGKPYSITHVMRLLEGEKEKEKPQYEMLDIDGKHFIKPTKELLAEINQIKSDQLLTTSE